MAGYRNTIIGIICVDMRIYVIYIIISNQLNYNKYPNKSNTNNNNLI